MLATSWVGCVAIAVVAMGVGGAAAVVGVATGYAAVFSVVVAAEGAA